MAGKVEHTMTPEQIAEWEQRLNDGTLWAEPWDSRLVDVASERWPDRIVPWGGYVALARELGLASDTVRGRLQYAGFRSGPRPNARHGSLASYFSRGCRCEACREVASIYNRERHSRRKQANGAPAATGTPQLGR